MRRVWTIGMSSFLLLWLVVACTSSHGDNVGALSCAETDCELKRRTCIEATDTSYATCGDCTSNYFDAEGVCEPYQVECKDDQYIAKERTPTSDRVCTNYNVTCAADEYESRPRGPNHDRECTKTSDCSKGQYIAQEPTATTDRQCAQCDVGEYCNGEKPEPLFCGLLDHDSDPSTPCAQLRTVHVGKGAACVGYRSQSDEFSSAECWSHSEEDEPFEVALPNDTSVRQLEVAGPRTACAVDENHQLHCWGTTDHQNAVNAGYEIKIMGRGLRGELCVVTHSHEIRCWGQFLTNPDVSLHEIPVERVVQIGTGSVHACVLLDQETTDNNKKGKVICWGGNGQYQASVPPNLPPIDEISVGAAHTCARTRNGRLFCWGQPSAYPDTDEHAQVYLEHEVVQVSAGDDQTCVVTLDGEGSVQCWGVIDPNYDPTTIRPKYVAAVSAGKNSVCVLRRRAANNLDGLIVECWDDRDHALDGAMPPEFAP